MRGLPWDRLDLNKEISQQKGKSPCAGAVTQPGLTGSSTAATTRVCSSAACIGTVPILFSLCYVPFSDSIGAENMGNLSSESLPP